MLKIFDKNHNAIGHIVKYKDCKIESELSTGDKTIYFTYLAKHHSLTNEMYVRTKDDEYVIKEVPWATDSFPQIVAVLNLEDLQKDMWQTFSVTDVTIDEAVRTVLAGTGWTIGECNVTKRRNAGMMQVSSLEVIQNLCKAFMCEPVFDTINKKVSFYVQRGEDKGVYFMSGLNLKKLQKKSTSYDYYTRIIPIGANGLTIEAVNDGKNYLENYQYSNKSLTYIWKDESYTDAQALKDDAELKLNDLSKPTLSYSADVRDLAKQKTEYAILSYSLGDNVTLIDRETGTRDKQRIVKLVEYPQDPEKNTCELANTVLTFEEMQQKVQEAASIINFTIAGDGRYTGTINVSDILHFEQGVAGSTTISGINSSISSMQGDLAQVKITVGEIDANYIKADEAELKYATIENLNVTNETVHSIQGDYASFKSTVTNEFAATTADITNLTGRFSTFEQTVTDELITAKGWMAEGSIGSAQISSVDANKIKSGTIDTAIVTIAGSDGRLQISDNTMQISDANRVRVQVGKDASGDYTLAVWDSSGKLIWDALGATENTIQRKIIRDKMVADDAAIQALKLDLHSFNTALTNQGVTISGTVVQVGDKTLNVALTEQSQAISEHGEILTDHAARIEANENDISLRVTTQVYESYKSTVDGEIASAKSRLSTAESSITALNGQIALKVEQTDIDAAVKKVDDKFANYSTTTKMNTAINQKADSITQSVSATYATKSSLETANSNITSLTSRVRTAESKLTKDGLTTIVGDYYTTATVVDSKIDGIQVGGRNLALKTGTKCTLTGNNTTNQCINIYNLSKNWTEFAGKWVNISFDYKYSDDTTATSEVYSISIGMGASPWVRPANVPKPSTSKSGHVSESFYVSTNVGSHLFVQARIDYLSGSCTISNFKFEEGNKPTDWTPAPEDVDSSISAVNTIATQAADHFNWLVKSGTSSTDFTLTDRTATLVANAINLKGLVTFSGLDSAAQKKITTAQSTADTAKSKADSLGVVHSVNGNGNSNMYINFATLKITGSHIDIPMSFRVVSSGYEASDVQIMFGNVDGTDPGLTYFRTNGTIPLYMVKTGTSTWNVIMRKNQTWSACIINNYHNPVGVNVTWTSDQIASVPSGYVSPSYLVEGRLAQEANTTLANWCYNNDKTYINGGKIYTGTIAAAQIASNAITTDKLATDAIKSKNYAYSSGNYSTAGTFLDLSNGLIRSKNFAIDSSGNAYLKGKFYSSNYNAWGNEWTSIDESVIKGGINESYDSLIDLCAQYADDKRKLVIENKADGILLKASALEIGEYNSYLPTSVYGNINAHNDLNVLGALSFKPLNGSELLRPVGSDNTSGNRVAYMTSGVTDGTYYINVRGQFGTSGIIYTSKKFNATSSDIRLKENISPTEVNALSVINQMGLYQFDWKQDGYHQKIGFVADYLEQQDEHLAIGGGYDEDGNMDEKSVNSFYLMGYAIKGIQELSTMAARVEERLTDVETIARSTQSEMASLKSQVSSLRYQLEQAYTKIATLEKQLQAVW